MTVIKFNFCYIIALLGLAFTPGEAGFCICFYGLDLDTTAMDTFCLIDSALIFMASFFLLLGLFKEKGGLVLAYVLIVICCEIAYWVIFTYTLVTKMVIMHYEFMLPTILWKLFQLIGLFFVIKSYIGLKEGASKEN